jgi:OOP family OmpA-OmpF porin
MEVGMKNLFRVFKQSTMALGLAVMLITPAWAANHGGDVMFVRLAENFIVLHDSSSSMKGEYGTTGLTKLEAENEILREQQQTLPELDWNAGVYTFTPRTSQMLKPLLSMRPYNKDEFGDALGLLPTKAGGATFLRGGMAGLDPILADLSGRTIVYIFTDGQMSDQPGFPAPSVTAKNLAAKYDVCFVVIDTDDAAGPQQAEIDKIASTTGCSRLIPFSDLLGKPEYTTNLLYMLKKVEAPMGVTGITVEDILFAFDSSEITMVAEEKLGELAEYLKENPGVRVTLAGHTDSVGSEEYNLALSQRRAQSARAVLVEQGDIDPSRISLSWFGFSDPVASNDTEEGRALNRRVDAIITDN